MPAPKGPIKYKKWCKKMSERKKLLFSDKKNHPMFGKPRSAATRKKLSEANKGKNNPNFGKHHSEEHRKKISESRKGKRNPPITIETRKKMSESRKGEKNGMYGKHHTVTTLKKISEANKGENHPMFGKHQSEEHRKKRLESIRGEKHPNWKGGTTNLLYCYKFNIRRRRATRIFFGYSCICCGKHVTENITKHGQVDPSVHHVDHDKEQGCGGKPFNLVLLCHECHGKEQHHKQEYKDYINKTLEEGFKWGIWSREQYEKEVMYPE